ncbi:MAG TPA: oxygenase MpaB family protein [Acidimicrobiales bacterium]|nr:oxygenase MpaB family protein [Acidimicrobiales bacterium]
MTSPASPLQLPFGPSTLSWRIGHEPIALLLGGPRAVLLQVAHPLVAAGVEQHSDYRRDPFSRGYRTLDWLFKVQFGDPGTVQHHAAALAAVHRRVKGVSPDGVAYRADDPELLLWVWATLVDSAVLVYDRFVRPLDGPARQRFYAEQKLVARATGLEPHQCPDTWEAFEAYVAAMIEDELRVTDTTRQVATGASPFFRAPLSNLLRPVDGFLFAALLPERLRRELNLPWGTGQAAALDAAAALSRRASRVVPRRLRHAPASYLTGRPEPLRWRPPAILLRRTG